MVGGVASEFFSFDRTSKYVGCYGILPIELLEKPVARCCHVELETGVTLNDLVSPRSEHS